MVELSKTGIRIADDDIYLNEDRYGDPKEMFKFISLILPKDKVNKGSTIAMVGKIQSPLMPVLIFSSVYSIAFYSSNS